MEIASVVVSETGAVAPLPQAITLSGVNRDARSERGGPAMNHVMTNSVLEAALSYRSAGLSVIPIGLNGLKQPAFTVLPHAPDPERPGRVKATWQPYRHRLATGEELRRWFGTGRPCGIALICGAVSGGLECLDFDDGEIAQRFLETLRADNPGLYKRLSFEKTPCGVHVWYRCTATEGSRKLAWPSKREYRRLGRPFKALIETRGEGGYAIVAGSPREVHVLERPYRHIGGPPLTQLARLTTAERHCLFRLAASFDSSDVLMSVPRPIESGHAHGLSPADDYDLRGEPFSELLPDAVFSHPGRDEGKVRRPGKGYGSSATVGYCRGGRGEPLLKVFTSSWPPFEPGRCYGRFHVLRLTRFGGDGAATLRWLRERGFGTRPVNRPNRAIGTTPAPAETLKTNGCDVRPTEHGMGGRSLPTTVVSRSDRATLPVARPRSCCGVGEYPQLIPEGIP